MMRVLEAFVFVGLAASAHLGVWAFSPTISGATSAGGGGQDETTLVAATAAQSAMVADWQRPPEVDITVPSVSQTPTPPIASLDAKLPQMALGMQPPNTQQKLVAPLATQAPQIDTTSAAPPPARKPVPKRPVARTKVIPNAAAPSAASQKQAAKRARGAPKTVQTGSGGTTDLNAQSAAQANALRARWGARIHAKIQRNMRYPKGTNGRGTTKVALRIASNGKLQDLRLTRSSGDSAFDNAALRAVSKAGRFSRAPKDLKGTVHDFSLSLTFAQ